ncbi:ParB/RepB/Spo0J family partition protein [Candidatus Nomurabacteria bacterium]|nr:ParB/RepB/Spo0J family partition protein [Candidatus Nomurabacteria bacterium]
MSFQGDSIFWVELDKVVPNPYQPRREFDEQKLKELAESIRMYGVLQPLTVTRRERTRDDGTFFSEYELIAGERRLRASKLAGLSQVPVIIRQGEQTEQEKLELAIIENLQREDLNAVDRALAFQQLTEVFHLTHAQVAAKMGRSREYVSNTLRILALPEYMLSSLRRGEMSEGHSRALLMLVDRPEEQDVLYREILLKKISVRESERISRKIATDRVRKRSWQDSDPGLIELERKLTETLGTRVQIKKTDFGGTLSIDYFDPTDLDKIFQLTNRDGKSISDEGMNAVDVVNETLQEEASEANEVMGKLEENTPLEEAANMEEEWTETPNTSLPAIDTLVTPPAVDDLVTEPAVDNLVTEPAVDNLVTEPAVDELVTPPTPDNFVTPPTETFKPNEDVVEESSKALLHKFDQTRAEKDDSNIYSLKNFNI